MPECPEEKRETVFKAAITVCITMLNSDQLHTSVAKEIVGKILLEVLSHTHTSSCMHGCEWLLPFLQVGKLSGSSVVALAELLIEGIKTGAVSNGQ